MDAGGVVQIGPYVGLWGEPQLGRNLGPYEGWYLEVVVVDLLDGLNGLWLHFGK